MNYVEVFEAIQADPRYQKNIQWGKARRGHPEGTVEAHIVELERNLELLRPKLSDEDYQKLKILIHVHDSFKAEAESGVAITDPRSHASLARSFLAEFCSDSDLLTMVQYHDEPYALWLQVHRGRPCNEERYETLVAGICDWNLFIAFLIIDNCTVGKGRESLRWFLQKIEGRVPSAITQQDIIETV
jgi:hypothetical protein